MTPLADMIPAMSDPDLKALRANAARLSETGSAVQMNTAAEILPLIDAETARRAADKTTTAVRRPALPSVGNYSAAFRRPADSLPERESRSIS